MSRSELRQVLDTYEKAVETDAAALLRPTVHERALIGDDVLRTRTAAIRRARDANRRFVEAMVEDLPDLCAGPDAELIPPRPVAGFRCLQEGVSTLPTSSYGSLASVFLHLLRDWSTTAEHVVESTYKPAIAELTAILPRGGEVLLPGAGLGRLAVEIQAAGYVVEANDASKLFLTVADYLLNRAPCAAPGSAEDAPGPQVIFPLAHVYSENWALAQQYIEITVPSPSPASRLLGANIASANGVGTAMATDSSAQPTQPITLVPGDFMKTYGPGGTGKRRFDAIVTCFFLDTVTDLAELFEAMDGLLDEGGVWVNVGPLNWKKDARLKLCWDEVVSIWEKNGYEFLARKSVDCDYHLPRGNKMYTESYQCALTAAVKRRPAKP